MFQMEKLTRLGAVHFKYYFAIFSVKGGGRDTPKTGKIISAKNILCIFAKKMAKKFCE